MTTILRYISAFFLKTFKSNSQMKSTFLLGVLPCFHRIVIPQILPDSGFDMPALKQSVVCVASTTVWLTALPRLLFSPVLLIGPFRYFAHLTGGLVVVVFIDNILPYIPIYPHG